MTKKTDSSAVTQIQEVLSYFKNTKLKNTTDKNKNYKLYVSLNSIKIKDFIIKASSLGEGILVVVFNTKTIESYTRYFIDELEAANFMSSIGARQD